MHIGYWCEMPEERVHQEDKDVGGWWIILKWILERWDGMGCIDVAQDKDQWRALVNMLMNVWVP
jgi:hypothetical protein